MSTGLRANAKIGVAHYGLISSSWRGGGEVSNQWHVELPERGYIVVAAWLTAPFLFSKVATGDVFFKKEQELIPKPNYSLALMNILEIGMKITPQTCILEF